MNDFKLKKHSVKEASFIENREKEKKKNIEIKIDGGILIPKDYDNSKYVVVKLKIHLGSPEERFYLILETLSVFEVEKERENTDISEVAVRVACLPVALSELRRTVKKVTEAYGMPGLDLPPFEEENIEE